MPHAARHHRANRLLINVMGDYRPGLLDRLTRAVMEAGCHIRDGHSALLDDAFSATLLVSGNWNTLSKLEGALEGLRSQGLEIQWRRTAPPPRENHSLPYSVDVIALDQPGILHQLVAFFSARGVSVQEMDTRSYTAAPSGTPMFTAHLGVEIPVSEHIAALRDDFLDLCDELNLDGVIEPYKA
ncbi:glycine cleavage system protein R [Ectothiorhodospira mobilis]|uniref:glycine cleavage system protein R n=1 Tax=Ectothiorhodospira mobilis TaxID=195064 RepID=UPI001905C4EF|nr:ACT domain-containing protein [Ectothiorhodospira mobilis]MBK1691262.1 glycine cleavage system protein R [Ectothiorhodospira mobilis]